MIQRGNTWLVLSITLSVQAMASMATLAVPAIAPAMAEALGVSPSLIGVYVPIVYLGAITSSLISGPLVLRWGAIRISQIGLVICACGMALQALSHSVPASALGALLAGLGYGPITPAASDLLAKSTPPHQRAFIFSLKQTGVPVGGMLAGFMLPAIVVAGGTSAAFWAVAAGCMAFAFIAQPLRQSLDSDRRSDTTINVAHLAGPVQVVWRDTALARLSLFALVFCIVQTSMTSYLVTYLHLSLGYTLLAAGAALSIAQMGAIVGRLAWGWIADRWLDARRMLAILALVMALCALLLALLQADAPRALQLALMVTFGASAIGWNGVYIAEVARLAPPGMASTATGGSMAIAFIGVLVGPLLFGALASVADSLRVAFMALAVPAAICAWQLARRPATAGA
ncbi:MAG: MFS transporter [Pseudomonadota bacterium]